MHKNHLLCSKIVHMQPRHSHVAAHSLACLGRYHQLVREEGTTHFSDQDRDPCGPMFVGQLPYCDFIVLFGYHGH